MTSPYLTHTWATVSGLLTATGSETVYDTTVAIDFAIDGKAFVKATVANGVTPTANSESVTFTTLIASQGCTMVWSLDSSGTVVVAQGDIQALDSAGDFIKTPSFPYVEFTLHCPFAYQVLKAGSTAGTITFGSSDWDATGFTQTIQNVHSLPARPQES